MTTGDYSTKELLKQEEDFSFPSFTNEDAITLGQEMLKIATSQKAPVIVQVHSSMYVRVSFEENNQTFEEHSGLDNELYAAHGGGFPIMVTGQGVVGVALVSGLPQVEDHKMIIQGLTNFKRAKS